MSIVFWGTPDFATIILEKLIKKNYRPCLIVTAPDKPKGRHHLLSAPAVKKVAEKYKIPYLQPLEIKENKELKNKIMALKPDLFIVAAYGLIVPQELLNSPSKKAINIHPSLLPKYRGPSPIQTAILNGDEFSGVTLILMTEKMDAGPIIKYEKIKINPSTKRFVPSSVPRGLRAPNYLELSNELANLGADLLIKVLPDWLEGKIKPLPQAEGKASYTKIIKKEDGLLDFNKSAEEIEKQIRAFYPWPSAYTKIPVNKKISAQSGSSLGGKNKILKILEAEVLLTGENKKKGLIFQKEKEMAITCSKNSLLLKKIQLEGKKEIDGASFLNGHRYLIGTIISIN